MPVVLPPPSPEVGTTILVPPPADLKQPVPLSAIDATILTPPAPVASRTPTSSGQATSFTPSPLSASAPPPPPPPPPPPELSADARRDAAKPARGRGLQSALIAIIVSLVLIIAALSVVLLFSSGILGLPTAGPSTSEVPSTPTGAPSSASATPSPKPTQTPTRSVSPREQALKQLNDAREESMQDLRLDGSWILQIGSKYEGVVDERETTASGSHEFMLPDIWAVHEELADRFADEGDVLLLQATDFGRQVNLPSTTWVTIIRPTDYSIPDYDSGVAHCSQLFPSLTGDDLANACVPRQLKPPF